VHGIRPRRLHTKSSLSARRWIYSSPTTPSRQRTVWVASLAINLAQSSGMSSAPPNSRTKTDRSRLKKQWRLFSIDEKDEERIDDPVIEPTRLKSVTVGHPFQREILLDPFGLPLSPQPIPDERDPLTWSHGRKMGILAHISIMSFLSQFLANSIVSNHT
jgi:hypothetical protein